MYWRRHFRGFVVLLFDLSLWLLWLFFKQFLRHNILGFLLVRFFVRVRKIFELKKIACVGALCKTKDWFQNGVRYFEISEVFVVFMYNYRKWSSSALWSLPSSPVSLRKPKYKRKVDFVLSLGSILTIRGKSATVPLIWRYAIVLTEQYKTWLLNLFRSYQADSESKAIAQQSRFAYM